MVVSSYLLALGDSISSFREGCRLRSLSGTRRESVHGGSSKTSLFLKVPERDLSPQPSYSVAVRPVVLTPE